MFTALFPLTLLGFFIIKPILCGGENQCPDGRLCPPHWLCCEVGCCAPGTVTSRREEDPHKEPGGTWYNTPWYAQWSVLFLLGTMGGIVICCVWCLICRRSSHGVYMCSFACCVRRPTSEHDSAGSVYPPPHYSRCGSFHQAPPPYSEVTSKPDLYPLVITCGDSDGKAGGNYLMVHYFKNYVIRAPGSLSATSTAESLNSSFICNAANEANSIIPPPYSCASNYPECGAACGRSLLRSLSSLTDRAPPTATATATATAPAPLTARARTTSDSTNVRSRDSAQAFRDNLITSPVQPLDPTFDLELELIDCEMYCDGGCKPRLGASPPAHRSPAREPPFEPEARALRLLPGAGPECESPPRPTSPTQSRDSLRRPSDERRPCRRRPRRRRAALYAPLAAASRSAPATPVTPVGALVPGLLAFTQRVSASRCSERSSRLDEETDPLLFEVASARADRKF